jgi:hypothetical protein
MSAFPRVAITAMVATTASAQISLSGNSGNTISPDARDDGQGKGEPQIIR